MLNDQVQKTTGMFSVKTRFADILIGQILVVLTWAWSSLLPWFNDILFCYSPVYCCINCCSSWSIGVSALEVCKHCWNLWFSDVYIVAGLQLSYYCVKNASLVLQLASLFLLCWSQSIAVTVFFVSLSYPSLEDNTYKRSENKKIRKDTLKDT